MSESDKGQDSSEFSLRVEAGAASVFFSFIRNVLSLSVPTTHLQLLLLFGFFETTSFILFLKCLDGVGEVKFYKLLSSLTMAFMVFTHLKRDSLCLMGP